MDGYKKSKQIIMTGESNENQIIIEKGLNKGDVVLLSVPLDADELEYSGTELIEEIMEKRRREEEEKQRRIEEERKKQEELKKQNEIRQKQMEMMRQQGGNRNQQNSRGQR
jgi:hypothetical protein